VFSLGKKNTNEGSIVSKESESARTTKKSPTAATMRQTWGTRVLLHWLTVVQVGYTGWSGMVFIEPIPKALLNLTMLPVVL